MGIIKRHWESITLFIIGTGAIYLGGMLRPYAAFGGEDLAGLAIIALGLWPERRSK